MYLAAFSISLAFSIFKFDKTSASTIFGVITVAKGKSFSFKVPFQRWLKNNPDKTYGDAIEAYQQIIKEKKKVFIDKQFEYNTYIRDFFNDNKGKTLEAAIKCWKYKKSLPGHNRYEKEDLIALKNNY